jgi:6-hydroxytryprostatin B O-methyltransferase
MGGSTGHISTMLARRFPQLHFVVQDLPGLAEPFAAALPAELKDRITFQAHDFFAPQPAAAAAAGSPPPTVFMLKHILHDWPDARAAAILASLVPALRAAGPRARVLLVEGVLPPPGAAPSSAERIVRTLDLVMMAVLAAKERGAAQWAALLRAAHPALVVKRVHEAPLRCAFGVVEAALEE